MTLVQSQAVSLSSSDLVKMEERKRPASYDHDVSAPPLKRQATTVNGTSSRHIDADMPWKDDLEVSHVHRALHVKTLRCCCGGYIAYDLSVLIRLLVLTALSKRGYPTPDAGI